MRTVHETEALRPSDPVPKSMQATGKSKNLKIIIKTPQSHAAGQDDDHEAMEMHEATGIFEGRTLR